MTAEWKEVLAEEATEDDQLLCHHFLGDKKIFGGEIDEDPPPRRSQRIVQAHELESEARRLARDLEHKDHEAADEDHKAH